MYGVIKQKHRRQKASKGLSKKQTYGPFIRKMMFKIMFKVKPP